MTLQRAVVGKQTRVQLGLFAKATHRYTIGMVACNLTPSRAAANSLLVWEQAMRGLEDAAENQISAGLVPDDLRCLRTSS